MDSYRRLDSKIVISLLSALVLLSCERATQDNAKASIALPSAPMQKTVSSGDKKSKVSVLTLQPSHVIVNITGSGADPKYCHVRLRPTTAALGDCKLLDGEGKSIEIETKAGTGRLIQVLVAYEDNEGSTPMSLKYGDTTTELRAGPQSVEIFTTDVPGAITMGHIAGRYLAGASGGPTGRLRVGLRIKEDKIPMVLVETDILAGWFQTMVAQGIKAEYMVDGQMLFGAPVDKDYFDQLATTQAAAPKFKINTQTDGFEIKGWFGDVTATASKSISANCSSARFTTCLDGQSYFVGPFASRSDGKLLATGATLQWEYLPGAMDSLDGVRLLFNPSVKDLKVNFAIDRGEYDCDLLQRQTGTVFVDIPKPATSVALPASMDSSSLLSTNFQYALCPYRGPGLLRTALAEPDLNSISGGDGSSLDYFRIDVSGNYNMSSQRHEIEQGQCVQAKIRLYHSTGQNTAVQLTNHAAMNLGISGLGNATLYATESICQSSGSALSGTLSMPLNTGETASFWIKGNTVSVNNQFSPITGFDTSVYQFQPSYNQVDILTAGATGYLRIESPPEDNTARTSKGNYYLLTKDYCHPFRVVSVSSSGLPSPLPESLTLSSLTSGGGMALFSNANCTTGLSSLTMNSGASESSTIYIKGLTAGTSNHISMNLSSSIRTYAPQEFRVAQPKLMVVGPKSVMDNTCYPFKAVTLLANESLYPQAGVGPSLTWNFGGASGISATIYDNLGACQVGTAGTNTIGGGNSTKDFFGKTTASGGIISPTLAATGFETWTGSMNTFAAGDSVATKIRIFAPATFKSGECTEIRAAVTNSAGAEVPARLPLKFTVRPASFTGSKIPLYTDPGCYGPVMSQEQNIDVDDSGRTFYGRAITDNTASFTPWTLLAPPYASEVPMVSTSAPTGGLPSLNLSGIPSNFGSVVIGSHEFGASRTMNLTVSGASNVFCSEFNGSSFSPCDPTVFNGSGSPYTFNWKLAAATNPAIRYRFDAETATGDRNFIEFDPQKIYDASFQVATCGAGGVQNVSFNSSTLTTLLASNQTVCFGSSVTMTCDATVNIPLDKKLVGWSIGGLAINDSGLSGGASCLNVSPSGTPTQSVLLANLNMSIDASGCASGEVVGISSASASPSAYTILKLIGVNISTASSASCPVVGLSVSGSNGNWDVEAQYSTINMDRSTDTTGIYLSANSGGFRFRNGSGSTTGSTNKATFIRHAHSAGSSGVIDVAFSNFTGPDMVVFDGSTGSSMGSRLSFMANTYNSATNTITTPIFSVNTATTQAFPHDIIQNLFRFAGTGAGYLVSLSDSAGSATDYIKANFSGNAVVQDQRGNIFTDNASKAGTLSLNANSFMSVSSTNNGNDRIYFRPPTGSISLSKTLPSATGDNRVCDTHTGTQGWSGGLFSEVQDGSLIKGNISSADGATPLGAPATFCP